MEALCKGGEPKSMSVVYQSFPTSNHNCTAKVQNNNSVVYHSFPTSNHNHGEVKIDGDLLYITLFLHQTTTMGMCWRIGQRCISLFSYIKPQPRSSMPEASPGCISLFSYIKPQRRGRHPIATHSCISLFSYIKPQQSSCCGQS